MRILRLLRRIRALRRARLLRERSGVTALEFAFIAPVLMLMMMGIVEFSLIMFSMAAMESATIITARLGKTGYVAPNTTRDQMIRDNIKNRTAGLLNPNLIDITYKVYSNFDKVGQPEPCIIPSAPPCPGTAGTNFSDINGNGQWDSDMGAAGLGNAGDVVVYTIVYPWPVMTPGVGVITGNPFNIIVRTVVRNEPYGSAVAGG